MLIIVSTHPIQYQTPIWQALAADGRVPFEVWYLTDFGTRPSHDREFGKTFSWDIEILSGYPYRFLRVAEGAAPTDFWKCRLRERVRDRLREAGAKAVWVQGWQVAGYWQAVYEAKAAGAKVWLRGESNDLVQAPWWKQATKRAMLGCLFGQVDRFFCIGSANRRLYAKFGVSEMRLLSAPYAVDNERFARQAGALRGERAQLRQAFGIPPDLFCVLFCGKLIPKKRPLDLVRAARLLRSAGRIANIHLLFAGSGELDPAVRAACSISYDAENPTARVDPRAVAADANPPASFAGFLNQTEISRAYVAADCLVLPSDHGETWGLVVNEALASGLPSIVSDACGCAEDMVGAERTFALGDVEALATALQRLRSGPTPQPAKALPSFDDIVSVIVNTYKDIETRAT